MRHQRQGFGLVVQRLPHRQPQRLLLHQQPDPRRRRDQLDRLEVVRVFLQVCTDEGRPELSIRGGGCMSEGVAELAGRTFIRH